jgi:asparagine synthase (glutamine-hydrolysing)
MCRIAGVICKDKILDSSPVESMLATMWRGGCDDTGIYRSENVCFGHNRLAIIDTSKDGHQPMKSGNDNMVLTFNGEIYNYQEIRVKLQRHGYSFQTQTDTEVIITAYEHWGIKCISLFEGIFAFAIYDRQKDKIFLVRDYPGVKPLYYFLSEEKLIFASEVKAFKSFGINFVEKKDWEVLFLAFGFLPYPFTTIEGVIELTPGSVLELSIKDFSIKKNTFFEIAPDAEYFSSDRSGLERAQDSVEKAFLKNLISDAPLGIFLSGGLDSSIITIFADRHRKELKTISVNFDESSFDESFYQKEALKLTKHTEHTSHRISKEMFWDNLPEFFDALDQPTVDGVNAFFISRCAKKEGLKAVLSGIGADELFGGYVSFTRIFWLKLFRKFPIKKALSRFLGFFKDPLSRVVYLDFNNPIGDYLFLRGLYTPAEIAKLTDFTETQVISILKLVSIKQPFTKKDQEYVSFLESKIYLRNQLLRDFDTMGMWHGLEVRVPFLDVNLIKTLCKVNPKLRFRGNKYLLREIYGSQLPPSILTRKKKGFTFPFGLWLKGSIDAVDANVQSSKGYTEARAKFLSGQTHWSKIWVLVIREQFKSRRKTEMNYDLLKSVHLPFNYKSASQ